MSVGLRNVKLFKRHPFHNVIQSEKRLGTVETHALHWRDVLGKAIPVPGGFKVGWNDFQTAILSGFDAILSHSLAVDPPLRLQDWLDDVLAATAEGDAHLIVLGAAQQALAVQPFHHRLTHLHHV